MLPPFVYAVRFCVPPPSHDELSRLVKHGILKQLKADYLIHTESKRIIKITVFQPYVGAKACCMRLKEFKLDDLSTKKRVKFLESVVY